MGDISTVEEVCKTTSENLGGFVSSSFGMMCSCSCCSCCTCFSITIMIIIIVISSSSSSSSRGGGSSSCSSSSSSCCCCCCCRCRCRHLNVKKWSEPFVLCAFWLGNVLRATTACTFSTFQLPKVVRTCGVLYILTWKCASRHNNLHFFNISTSKSGPNMVYFVHFDLDMCFAPQQRALFRYLNFQKWCETVGFWHSWLGNVLRTTTTCNFFDISTSKSGLRMVCFVHFALEMCFAPQRRAIFSSLIWPHGSAPAALARLLFDPPEPQIIGKTQWIVATFLPFRAPAFSCFSLILFSDLLTSWLLLPDPSHLYFSISAYCRKFDF